MMKDSESGNAEDRCPADDQLRDLIADRLLPAHREFIEIHLGTCSGCQDRILSAATEREAWPVSSSGSPGHPDATDPWLYRTFLGRLKEAVRLQVGSAPGPGPWDSESDGSEDTATLPTIRGVEIYEQIGRGGMGTVYRARQIGLDRSVAVKLIWAGRRNTIENVIRMARGPRTVARLAHPNIIQVFQVGKQDGWLYAVFEYIDGGDLKSALRDGPWPPARAASLVRVLAEAVHFMHESGVVHCDLKSSNILLTAAGIPKIADFGLARKFHDDEASVIEPGSARGSPGYMPPEQATGRGAEIGPASDIHALGAILYELLVGRTPFHGPTPAEILRQVVEKAPDPPSRLRPGLPRVFDAICGRCLEKEPDRRYGDARELADELSRYLDRAEFTPAWLGRFRTWIPSKQGKGARPLREAHERLSKLDAELEEAERELYLSRLVHAEESLERGDSAAANLILRKCAPKPGRPDRRDLKWRELWDRSEV